MKSSPGWAWGCRCRRAAAWPKRGSWTWVAGIRRWRELGWSFWRPRAWTPWRLQSTTIRGQLFLAHWSRAMWYALKIFLGLSATFFRRGIGILFAAPQPNFPLFVPFFVRFHSKNSVCFWATESFLCSQFHICLNCGNLLVSIVIDDFTRFYVLFIYLFIYNHILINSLRNLLIRYWIDFWIGWIYWLSWKIPDSLWILKSDLPLLDGKWTAELSFCGGLLAGDSRLAAQIGGLQGKESRSCIRRYPASFPWNLWIPVASWGKSEMTFVRLLCHSTVFVCLSFRATAHGDNDVFRLQKRYGFEAQVFRAAGVANKQEYDEKFGSDLFLTVRMTTSGLSWGGIGESWKVPMKSRILKS